MDDSDNKPGNREKMFWRRSPKLKKALLQIVGGDKLIIPFC